MTIKDAHTKAVTGIAEGTLNPKHVTIGTIKRPHRTKPATITAEINYKDGKLSITGAEAGGSSGQISYTPAELAVIVPAPGWSHLMISDFFRVWDKWHLNDMRAGCVHQLEDRPCQYCCDREPDECKAHEYRLDNCPHCKGSGKVPAWDTSKPIEWVSYSIDWDVFRSIERQAEKDTQRFAKGERKVSSSAVMTLRALENAGIKPFAFVEVSGLADLAYLESSFEFIGEHNQAQKQDYEKRLKRWQEYERGASSRFPIVRPVKPWIIQRTETKTANWVRSEDHPDGLLMKPCEVCGYKYGSKWLREEVPATVIEFLQGLPEGTEPDPAGDFLTAHGLIFRAVKAEPQTAPQWADEGGAHGIKYRITISRKGEPGRVSFDFWNSLHDKQKGEEVTPYDVLACISSDIYTPESFEDFCSEYGYDSDSRKARAQFRRCDQHARRLRAFFGDEAEREALSMIR